MDIADQYFEIAMQEGTIPYDEYLQKLYELWETIKNDYIQTKGSYLIVDNIVEVALNLKMLDVAEKWAEIAVSYDGKTKRNLGKEGEFRVAEVAFAKGNMKKASVHFQNIYDVFGERPFEEKNPKYLTLIKKK